MRALPTAYAASFGALRDEVDSLSRSPSSPSRCIRDSSGRVCPVDSLRAIAMRMLCILAIRGYQVSLGQLLPPSCRYFPSCSAYAIEAIEKAWRGTRIMAGDSTYCSLPPIPPGRV